MKIILQHNERDCGAVCLSMIAAHYGLRYPISKYREITKTDKTGTNLYGLVNGASMIGLDGKALFGSPDELLEGIQSGEITYPFIAHTVNEDGMFHYVVILDLRNGKFVINDPGKGRLQKNLQDFFDSWTGHVVIFHPKGSFQKGNYVRGNTLKFFGLLRGQYQKLVGILLISLVIAAIGIMGAFVFQIVIDNFVVQKNYENTSEEQLEENEVNSATNILEHVFESIFPGEESAAFHIIFISLICLYFLQAAIQYVRGYLIVSMSRKIDIRLSLSYYNHIVDLPVSSVSMYQTGEYMSRFSDASTIRQAISGATLTLLLDSTLVIACGIILIFQNLKLFFVSLMIILFDACIILGYRKPVENSNRQAMEKQARLQSYFKESLDGIETVKAACAEEQVKHTTTSKFKCYINAVFKSSLISMSQDTMANMVELIGTVVILWIGFSMVLVGQVTVGEVITFYALLGYFTEPIKNLIELQPMMQTALVAAERLNDIFYLEKETSESNLNRLPEIQRWEFRHVDFRYGNQELTLHDISLAINRGEKIALVGESGSGKTTLAKLLLRFYDPEQGSILLNGDNITTFDLHDLRRNISYVDQNTFLFSDTIKNNLKMGSADATDKEMELACKISRSDEFINKLPFGYDTPLEENGMNLSGGQRQRLAISRALLKKPQLLIMDEATSNLDTITEASIKAAMSNFDSDITCIVIAHRLATVKNCDCIYVMDQGRIIETGKHEELMKKGGKYATLWNMQ